MVWIYGTIPKKGRNQCVCQAVVSQSAQRPQGTASRTEQAAEETSASVTLSTAGNAAGRHPQQESHPGPLTSTSPAHDPGRALDPEGPDVLAAPGPEESRALSLVAAAGTNALELTAVGSDDAGKRQRKATGRSGAKPSDAQTSGAGSKRSGDEDVGSDERPSKARKSDSESAARSTAPSRQPNSPAGASNPDVSPLAVAVALAPPPLGPGQAMSKPGRDTAAGSSPVFKPNPDFKPIVQTKRLLKPRPSRTPAVPARQRAFVMKRQHWHVFDPLTDWDPTDFSPSTERHSDATRQRQAEVAASPPISIRPGSCLHVALGDTRYFAITDLLALAASYFVSRSAYQEEMALGNNPAYQQV